MRDVRQSSRVLPTIVITGGPALERDTHRGATSPAPLERLRYSRSLSGTGNYWR